MLTAINILFKEWCKNHFSVNNSYGYEAEQYVNARQPKTHADVEQYIKEFDRKRYSGAYYV